jgi:hypothetical protein
MVYFSSAAEAAVAITAVTIFMVIAVTISMAIEDGMAAAGAGTADGTTAGSGMAAEAAIGIAGGLDLVTGTAGRTLGVSANNRRMIRVRGAAKAALLVFMHAAPVPAAASSGQEGRRKQTI